MGRSNKTNTQSQKKRHHRKSCRSHGCVKQLKVPCKADIKNLKVENVDVSGTLTAPNINVSGGTITAETINTTNANISNQLILNNLDVGCQLEKAPSKNITQSFDCMDCNGEPIKPDNIDQRLWDTFKCNRDAYNAQLQADLLAGRNQIRCIKQSYGCAPDCPPDCPVPSMCVSEFTGTIEGTVLTVSATAPGTHAIVDNSEISAATPGPVTIVPGTTIVNQISGTPGGVGTYTISIAQTVADSTDFEAVPPCPNYPDGCGPLDPGCIPDGTTCDLEIQNNVFATFTLPFYSLKDVQCFNAASSPDKFPFFNVDILNSISYNLNINNVTCNLGTRVSTILVQCAGLIPASTTLTSSTLPPPTTPCPVCPGDVPPNPLTCMCPLPDPTVDCGIIEVRCRQFADTININLGENFSGTFYIPTVITQAMVNATPLPFDSSTPAVGAFQMVIFFEDGLATSNNTSAAARSGKGACTTDHCGSYNKGSGGI